MDFVYIGKIVNTHGIKGEIRILSNFDKKSLVFKSNFKIYIGNNKEEYIINTYRKHKNFDMITLKGFNNINDVLKFKCNKVYVNRNDLNLNDNEYVLDDLLYMNIVYNNKIYGVVNNIFDNNGNILLEIKFENNYYIPYNSNYIEKVDLCNKTIYVNNVEDLIL